MLDPQRASENQLFSMQSTPAAAGSEAGAEDLWADWPYCWAIDLYDHARQCFHSFHEKHTSWKLARHNHRAQQEFRAKFWQGWQRDGEDEVLELRLV
jgi:hypothetical protein